MRRLGSLPSPVGEGPGEGSTGAVPSWQRAPDAVYLYVHWRRQSQGGFSMVYTAEVSRSNPSCFLFLIDRSGSMEDDWAGEPGKQKAEGLATVINRLLQNLVIKCAKSEGVRDYYHVGVLGYGDHVGPAFEGALAGQDLVPISQVADQPARVEDRT